MLTKSVRAMKHNKPRGYMTFKLKKIAIKWLGKVANKQGFYLFDEDMTIGRTTDSLYVSVNRGNQSEN